MKNRILKSSGTRNGFTLVELLISVAILSLISLSVSLFQRDIFSLNTTLQSGLNAQLEAMHVVRVMVAELREASQGSNGAYPITLAGKNELVFYSDIDSDGLKEQVRYYLSGKELKKGVIVPSGNPLTYNSGDEKSSILVSDVVASSTVPIFQYYPSTYTGTSLPLSEPIDIPLIRLVKITVIIDRDPHRSPVPIMVSSQVSIRNLKDNL